MVLNLGKGKRIRDSTGKRATPDRQRDNQSGIISVARGGKGGCGGGGLGFEVVEMSEIEGDEREGGEGR